MPGKPRHRKGRRLPQGKRRATFGQPVTRAQTTEAAQVRETAQPSSKASRPAVLTTAAADKSVLASVPYVTREVRTISILAAIILIVLIAVSLLLAR